MKTRELEYEMRGAPSREVDFDMAVSNDRLAANQITIVDDGTERRLNMSRRVNAVPMTRQQAPRRHNHFSV